MKVQAPPPALVRPRTLATSSPAQESAPPQDSAETKPSSFKSYLGGAGGFVAGTGAGLASAGATYVVAQQLGRIVDATVPALDGIAPGAGVILAQAAKYALLGSALVAGVGGAVGAQVAFAAANGATKPGITESPEEIQGGRYRQNAAELRENLGAIGKAETFKSAAAAGFRAGATLGGPAGATAGKIQGALLGAALGGVASVPLMGLVSHPAMLIPGAIAGALLGAKIGEPVGHAAGSFALGALGAAGGAAYHALPGKS